MQGWSTVDALYFSIITLSTVGLGDLYPETAGGRGFWFAHTMLGLGVVATIVGSATNISEARAPVPFRPPRPPMPPQAYGAVGGSCAGGSRGFDGMAA